MDEKNGIVGNETPVIQFSGEIHFSVAFVLTRRRRNSDRGVRSSKIVPNKQNGKYSNAEIVRRSSATNLFAVCEIRIIWK